MNQTKNLSIIKPNIKKYCINGINERIFNLDNVLKKDCIQYLTNINQLISVLGYGPQGQSLNLRDNGYSVIIGLREW